MGEERRRAEEFTGKLRTVYGDNLVAVVLYGSAARGEYRDGVSDLNLLVVLKHADAAALRAGSALAREWAGAGNPPPLLLGEREWRDSADVFAIEYTDMRDAHLLLHGSDPFAGLEIRWDDLRLQCEHELKSKQIRLREHYLLIGEDAGGLGDLLTQSFPTFLTLFRTALRVAGQPVPRSAETVIGALAPLAGFDPAPFLAIQRARGEGSSFKPAVDDAVVLGYLDGIERTTEWLDGLTTAPSSRDSD